MSLIEVLIAILLVSLSLLGAAGMHMRSIEFTTDTERRQMAAMVATELLETMRSDTATILQANGQPQASLGGYGKAAGTALSTVTAANCRPLSTVPALRVGCWGERAKQVIPELTDALITSRFAVQADAVSGVLSVIVAWPVKEGQCLDGSTNDYCTYTLRSRL